MLSHWGGLLPPHTYPPHTHTLPGVADLARPPSPEEHRAQSLCQSLPTVEEEQLWDWESRVVSLSVLAIPMEGQWQSF